MLNRHFVVRAAHLLLAIISLSGGPVLGTPHGFHEEFPRGTPTLDSRDPAEILAALPCQTSTFEALVSPGFTVEKVSSVADMGSYHETGNVPYPYSVTQLPALCAVIIAFENTTSKYRFGLFLPTSWNTRSLTVGQGGWAGGINWYEMGQGVKYTNIGGTPNARMAALSTDTGHSSGPGDIGTWGTTAREKNDWGWQAMAGSVQMGQTLIKEYYSTAISKSYYAGCSTGGRQGLRQIQFNQSSFHGLLIGAPAWQTTHLNSYACRLAKWNLNGSETTGALNDAPFKKLAAAARAQCDNDGTYDTVPDNIISFPEKCPFDYNLISCATAPGPGCLSATQIEIAKGIHNDMYTDDKSTLIYSGYEHGSEDEIRGVTGFLYNSSMVNFDCDWTKLWALGNANPSFTPADFNDTVFQTAVTTNPGSANADNFDLSSFRAAGSKILMYHGLADGVIPPRGSDFYYRETQRVVGGSVGSDISDFFRYFKVPGMQHCAWTPVAGIFGVETDVNAPWHFAGAGQAAFFWSWANPTIAGQAPPGVYGYPGVQYDALRTLIAWTEGGTGPESVIATTWDASTGMKKRQRPICAEPKRAFKKNGATNLDDAASWDCLVPSWV